MQDEVIYRCIHAACARPLPRKVNFCPYCGTGQHAGVDNPAHLVSVVTGLRGIVPQRAQQDAPALRAAHEAPSQGSQAPQDAPASEEARPAQGQQPSQGTQAPTGPAAAAQPASFAPRAATAARPPQRAPVRLRYWLLALALLAAIWFTAKPAFTRIDTRIDQAIALAANCKFNEAQSELIALRSTKATPQQLQRLQAALNEAVPACEKKRAKARAWGETTLAVDNALAASAFDKAQGRLEAFVRRWDEDSDTRGLKEKIAAMREAGKPGAEDVAPSPEKSSTALSAARQAQSARNLVAEADRELAQGNYKAAADKMETCLTMVDAGNRECVAVKARAERLNGDMLRCVANGSDWVNDRCQ